VTNATVVRLKDRLYAHQVDGTTLFRQWIVQALAPKSIVVDLGCGEGKPRTDVRQPGRFVIGCDIADDVRANAFVDARVLADVNALPFRDASIDVLTADFLLEHLAEPHRMAGEAFRVLRPGGALIIRTPNLWHYVALIGWTTPHWFHRLVANRVRGLDATHGHDVFPTYYRANTRAAVTRIFGDAGFSVERIEMVEREPSYLMFARLAFLVGVAYERFVNRSDYLARWRSNIFSVMRKRERRA